MPEDEEPVVAGAGTPAPVDAEATRRSLDAVTGQLEWVQDRLDELDAAAAAAAESLSGPPPPSSG